MPWGGASGKVEQVSSDRRWGRGGAEAPSVAILAQAIWLEPFAAAHSTRPTATLWSNSAQQTRANYLAPFKGTRGGPAWPSGLDQRRGCSQAGATSIRR